MPAADRRHAVGVARRVDDVLDDDVLEDDLLEDDVLGNDRRERRAVLAAALLHDVGKTASGLSTYGRVIATLSAAVGGRDQAEAWSETRGFTRRVGLYLRHPELGADQLSLAGSDPLTVAWTREHHLPPDRWTVPAAVGEILKAADDD
jgi:hypothetical protein